MPTLPFIPESVESLKARYPQCLIKVWKLSELSGNRPGMHRKYVFDFEDGLRLLISRDAFYKEDGTMIHVSCSWEDNTSVTPQSIEHATQIVTEHWHSIGGSGKLEFLGLSSNRIPHWLQRQGD